MKPPGKAVFGTRSGLVQVSEISKSFGAKVALRKIGVVQSRVTHGA